MMTSATTRSAGFTLLEILVSLVVLSLAMAALIKSAGSYTSNQAYLRDRTVAEWIARNQLVQMQVNQAWPSIGQKKDTLDYAGREWRWVMQVTQTAEENLRRLDIDIFPVDGVEHDEPVSRLSGFVANPT
ncbi:MAG: type II secretion system minor pseudopilin GspI [Gammaproteobacteria bacterium]